MQGNNRENVSNSPYRILYFGAPHSYCNTATEKVLPRIMKILCEEAGRELQVGEVPLVSAEDRETITGALDSSSDTIAVVPISNSKLGDVYDFMPFYAFQMIDKEPLDVQLWLCSKNGQLDEIKKVRTKNTAYEQVREELKKILPGVTVYASNESTSEGAKMAQSDIGLAAVCSPTACEHYKLQRVADLGTYVTTFGVFRNEPRITHAKPDIQIQMSLLRRGGKLYTGRVPGGGQQEFAALLSNKRGKLRVKWGMDPIRDSLHLGHFSNLLKLADFKALGHHIVVVLGTFTGKIGDPSGNLEQRERLDNIQLKKNADIIRRQITAILGDGIEFVENHTLAEPLRIEELLKWGYKIDIRLMHDRQDFMQRRASERAIYLSEFLYALFQAHDSIQLKVDVEVGGMDQIYNCALTRDIMVLEGISPEFALLLRLLPGTDGTAKMSSFSRNDIRLSEPRSEIRRKLMSIEGTGNVLEYLRLLTRIPDEMIENWATGLHGNKVDFNDVRREMTEAVLDMIPEQT
jgi:tyrosyl-tRNA synthetase/prephenate dehydratase